MLVKGIYILWIYSDFIFIWQIYMFNYDDLYYFTFKNTFFMKKAETYYNFNSIIVYILSRIFYPLWIIVSIFWLSQLKDLLNNFSEILTNHSNNLFYYFGTLLWILWFILLNIWLFKSKNIIKLIWMGMIFLSCIISFKFLFFIFCFIWLC